MPTATAPNARTTDSNQPQPSDPLSAAITAAVDAGLAARLPAIIDAVVAAIREPGPPLPNRFIRMNEVAQALSCTRSTVHRRAVAGLYPPLRRQGGTSGYLASELAAIIDPAGAPPRQKARAKTRVVHP
jgi:predicted DNA-binding transcriptional regulator AlpA